MKKIIICLVLASFVVSILTACPNRLPTAEAPAADTPSGAIQGAGETGQPDITPADAAPASPASVTATPPPSASAPPAADVSGLCKESGAVPSPDPEQYAPQPTTFKPKKHVIPVLYYHSVSDVPAGIRILSVTTASFEEQIQYLLENGYTPIYLNEDPLLYRKPVIITFDDGYVDNYTDAYPILEKYNVKATVFMVTSFVDTPGYLTTEQIKSMDLVSFQSHAVTHRKLHTLSEEDLLWELQESKDYLERLTGKDIYAICYPYGKFNSRVLELSKQFYDCGLTIMEGIETKIMGNYTIIRAFISRDDTLADFKRELIYGT